MIEQLAPVAAEIREAVIDGAIVQLRVDPVQLAALAEARAAGGTPSSYGALPDLDELPLRVVVIEARLERLEQLAGVDQ